MCFTEAVICIAIIISEKFYFLLTSFLAHIFLLEKRIKLSYSQLTQMDLYH